MPPIVRESRELPSGDALHDGHGLLGSAPGDLYKSEGDRGKVRGALGFVIDERRVPDIRAELQRGFEQMAVALARRVHDVGPHELEQSVRKARCHVPLLDGVDDALEIDVRGQAEPEPVRLPGTQLAPLVLAPLLFRALGPRDLDYLLDRHDARWRTKPEPQLVHVLDEDR